MSTPPQTPDSLSTDHLQADLKGRSVRGGAVTVLAQAAQFAINMVSTVVLARLLTPADFGLVAMVTVLTGFAVMFAEAGLSTATIQSKEINHRQISMLFWVNVAVGLALMLGIAASAPLLSWFYEEPRLVGITLLIAAGYFVNGLGVQHEALLRRQMRFRSLAIRRVTVVATGAVVAIVMAWRGAGYWALVASVLAAQVTRVPLAWMMVDWRPGLPSRGANIRSMLTLGGNQAAANFVGHLSQSLDGVLIGRFWGAGPLGLYSKAQSLLLLPFRQLDSPLAVVALPALSRIQDDPERLARYYLRIANLLTWVATPLVGFLFVAAHSVIALMLGDQWRESGVVFRIFALGAPVLPLLKLNGLLFQGRGRTDRQLKLEMIRSPVLVGSIVAGLPFGIRGVALSYTLVLLAMLPWVFAFTFSGTRLTLGRLGRAILCPVSVCLVAVSTALLALHLRAPGGHLATLLVVALAFVVAYSLGAVVPPVRRELRSLLDLLRELRPSQRPARSA